MTAAAVLVAVALDATLREPPAALHPVRHIGSGLDRLARWVPAGPPTPATVRGGLAWMLGAVSVTVLARGLDHGLRRWPGWSASVGRGVALWPLLSLAMLTDEVASVERTLSGTATSVDDRGTDDGDLEAARAAVGRLVSRDVSDADASQVRTAALSSLAENVSDAFVGPLLWFSVFGLPGAAAYRFVNTADAMWGYRDRRWAHAGRVAAVADDVANVLPSRLTGVVLAFGGAGWRTLRREARRTPSPNGGWPMAALALQLGIRCEKPGTYLLNAAGREPRCEDTARALRLVRGRALAIAAFLAVTGHGRTAVTRRRRRTWRR